MKKKIRFTKWHYLIYIKVKKGIIVIKNILSSLLVLLVDYEVNNANDKKKMVQLTRNLARSLLVIFPHNKSLLYLPRGESRTICKEIALLDL